MNTGIAAIAVSIIIIGIDAGLTALFGGSFGYVMAGAILCASLHSAMK